MRRSLGEARVQSREDQHSLMRASGPYSAVACLLWFALPGFGQTTQGILVGRVTDSVTGRGVPQIAVTVRNEATTAESPAEGDASGNYSVASLSPGEYRVTVTARGYQTQQARALVLPVSARVELNFRLRPLYDLFEAGLFRSWLVPGSQQAIGFYGPDVDTSRVSVFNANRGQATPLETSLSDVISRQTIETLPLVGRDVYTMLLLLPGVTSDTATARGLGFSVNGQRPSSSNYLLDGAENNNLLVSGPLSAVTPEFIEEYRISTANFSAEYGRTSGFLANAITRSGTNEWHGRAFFHVRNDRLSANGFQENAQGFRRAPFTELQPGFVVGAAPVKNRLFVAGGFVETYSHGRGDPRTFGLPTSSFISKTDPASYAGKLLRKYRPESSPAGSGDFGVATIAPANSSGREDSFLRIDLNVSQDHRLLARAATDTFRQHDLAGGPYPDFPVRYRQGSALTTVGLLSRVGVRNQNEFRVSRSDDRIALDTPNSDGPALLDVDRAESRGGSYPVLLPSSVSTFDYRNKGRNWELSDNLTRVAGRHVFKVGGGFLARSIDLSLAVYPRGLLQFSSTADFAASLPSLLRADFDRLSPTMAPLSPLRQYRYRQANAFVQDSFHVSNRLTLDYGLRYDYFGAPYNAGDVADFVTTLGQGSSIQSSIATATQGLAPAGAPVYTTRPSNWAVRAGGAWSPFNNGRTVIRASYGIFYDRLFDNLWENVNQNRFRTGIWFYEQPVNPGASLVELQRAGDFQNSSQAIAALAFQPTLRVPYTQSAFVSVQHSFTPFLSLEVRGQASRGRQLITTDQVNRAFSVPATPGNLFGRLNPSIDNDVINYRANQGSSDYSAASVALRFRRTRFSGQVSYTWSHSIDNQSESLAGTFFDFNTLRVAQSGGSPFISSFTRQFASSLDRGNSDFDQRHTAVFFFTWQPAAPPIRGRLRLALEDWTFGILGAMRSGLPFTVYAATNYSVANPEFLINQRADLLNPSQVYTSQRVAGGVQLLNPSAFAAPGPNRLGSSGRNAFFGPGLFNADASVARVFRVTESKRVTLRADFYNALNHANLNNPASGLGARDFGVALYGRNENNSGFPLLSPLSESGRQVQLFLRFEF